MKENSFKRRNATVLMKVDYPPSAFKFKIDLLRLRATMIIVEACENEVRLVVINNSKDIAHVKDVVPKLFTDQEDFTLSSCVGAGGESQIIVSKYDKYQI